MSVREARDTCRFFAGCTGLRTVAGCAIRRGAALKRFHSRNARLLVLYQPTIFLSLSLTTAHRDSSNHVSRSAVVYVRQSSASQVEHNRESTTRQYRLADRTVEFGWPRERVHVVDEDLGRSGSGLTDRSGFARMTAEVVLGHVGLVFGLEVSRLARNNADWYRLLDQCGVTDAFIGDADGIYHPSLFNDRLVLGLKGTMSEAELHTLRARLLGGIRNKVSRSIWASSSWPSVQIRFFVPVVEMEARWRQRKVLGRKLPHF
jgi:DNA invertase Pin-like site-specific DNA recombinase